jgi:hypothetical protein
MYDTEKWGNCLSGALQLGAYLQGLVDAGFLGLHQVRVVPWQTIDGIHFLSLTLTGYKLPPASEEQRPVFVTLRGPFSVATDELGQTYRRGVPRPVSGRTAVLLTMPPFASLFILADTPLPLTPSNPCLSMILPDSAPCIWGGDYAILTGPFLEVHDDDHHVYRRGQPTEICSKTRKVLESDLYRPHFALMNRTSGQVSGAEISCDPSGACC